MTQTTHRQLTCLAIILLLVPFGLVCRFVPIGLPQIIVKYGGSFLWAAMVYWSTAMLLPAARPLVLAFVAGVVATMVEYLKLLQTPGLNAFRDTFPGKVLLGRYFSYNDIAVYIAAIACAAWLDNGTVSGRAHRRIEEHE